MQENGTLVCIQDSEYIATVNTNNLQYCLPECKSQQRRKWLAVTDTHRNLASDNPAVLWELLTKKSS